MKKVATTLILAAVALTSIAACSTGTKRFSGRGAVEASPAVKNTLLSVSDHYLRNIAVGDVHQLNSYVLWSDYLSQAKGGMRRSEYNQQVQSILGRWGPAEHPLLGVAPVSVMTRGDEARVILRKPGQDQAPDIWIDFSWSGSGWLIVDDSLFGPSGLIEQWAASAS